MTTTATKLPPDAPKPRAAVAARTLRTDRWWLAPLLTVLGITAWLVYAVVHAYMQKWYFAEGPGYHYLTPFYSPCMSKACSPEAAEFGRFIPTTRLLPYAAVSLPLLLCFRLTCYYYRKAYYRSFWASPPACSVPDGHSKYRGETRFPLIMQNLHRYFVYAALLISLVNTWDMIKSFMGTEHVGFGLGNLFLLVNVVMLWGYTISCHSCRHLVAGRLKHFSKHPVRYKLWLYISKLNAHHMGLAWTTLASLALTDLYVMAISAGWFSDLRFIG
jgi:hypothetical protein